MKIKLIKKYNTKISKFIFTLRNKNYVRKNSLNKKIIFFKDHNLWLKNFFKKKNKLYLITFNKQNVGYIRLDYKKDIFNVSWALIKRFQKKGIANKCLKLATRSKNFRYKAVIKSSNLPSIIIAKNSNFRVKRKKKNIYYLYKY